jgi:hypothetical protein
MNPLLLLIPLGIGLYVWNKNRTTTTAVMQGTSPVQVMSASYSNGIWSINANVTQPDGAIASMSLAIPGVPTEQPTLAQVEAAAGQAQQQLTQPTAAEF